MALVPLVTGSVATEGHTYVTARADGWHVEARIVCHRAGEEEGTVPTATVEGVARK